MIARPLSCLLGAAMLSCVLHAASDDSRPDSHADCLAESLRSGYRDIETIACEIRKTTVSPEGSLRLLSRVFYKKPNLVHVNNIAPVKRLIISDGATLYYHQAGIPRGFSQPLERLDAAWADAVRNIPATPMEHLTKIEGIRPVRLQPTQDGLTRMAYHGAKASAVLVADERLRLLRIEFYDSPDMDSQTAIIEYGDFFMVTENCWIPRSHRGTLTLESGGTITETRHIHSLSVNGLLDDRLFDPGAHFSNVVFVSAFEETYQQESPRKRGRRGK